MATRAPGTHLELLDDAAAKPRLRLDRGLEGTPPETPTAERERAQQLWQSLQAPVEELSAQRIELAKADRAIVTARKQLFAVRAQAQTEREAAARAVAERFSPALVYGLGALALVALGGWVHQRRKLLAWEEFTDSIKPLAALPASPSDFPPPVEPAGTPEFGDTARDVRPDEADQWIAQSGVAIPAPR